MRADPVRSRNSHQKTQTDGRNAQRAVRSHSYIGLSEPKRELLENHWNGALLDSIEAVIRLAMTMTWKGKRPVVELVTTTYQRGVKLTKDAMQMVEAQLQRLPGLDKWFVDIIHHPG